MANRFSITFRNWQGIYLLAWVPAKFIPAHKIISLALPTYKLLLNFDFASVLGLVLRYAFQILEMYFLSNQRTEGVAENDNIDVVL